MTEAPRELAPLDPAVGEYLLAFADDEHMMGQQHTEWIGVAPFLEEDLAFASIAQDELGHAAALYAIVAGDSSDATIDALAFGRSPRGYRSCQLVEASLPAWEDTLIRHWCYDLAEAARWQLLVSSSNADIANLAVRALREEHFHIRHCDALLDTLLKDPDASRRLAGALERQLPLLESIWAPVAGETETIAASIASAPIESCRLEWQSTIEARFGRQQWSPQAPTARTLRHPDFAALHARINEVLLIDPDAVW